MGEAADVAAVEAIAARTAQQVVNELAGRLDEVLERQESRLDDLTTTVRLAAATLTTMVERLTETRPPRTDWPAELDKACQPDPDTPPGSPPHLRRVDLTVDGHAVTQYVAPGADPATLWDEIRASVVDDRRMGAWQN